MVQCYMHQDFPKADMEWIILDDGTDPIRDLVAHIQGVKYFHLPKKVCLGEKRNLMHAHATGEFIVYMDDDDYYPPTRVSHAVRTLRANPSAMCAGSSELYIYYKTLDQIYRFGPYGPNHATAGTFAFRRALLANTAYDSSAAFAEEKSFLKNYTVPFVQLDPKQVILVFAHAHNTYDKNLLLSPSTNTIRAPTHFKVKDFVPNSNLRHFYTHQMHHDLLTYLPGHPSMKPDVMDQLELRKHAVHINGRTLCGPEISDFIHHQQRYINVLLEKIKKCNL